MRYKPYRASKMHMLDYRRAEEKVAVHLDGDASRLLSINRGCVLVDTAEQIDAVAEQLAAGAGDPSSDVVAIMNRFAVPAVTGYRDLKALIRDKSTGYISTMRVVHAEYESTTYGQTAPSIWAMRQIATHAALGDVPRTSPVVVLSDNYLRDDEQSLTAVHGFMHVEQAWHYAMSRFKDGIRVLADEALSTQDLRYSWLVYGEDVAILSDGQPHCLGLDLMAYVIQIRIPDVPYWRFEEDFGLQKTAVTLIDPGDQSITH